MRVAEGGGAIKKRRRNLKGLHVIHANKDVDFVDAPTSNSSKFGKSERVILSDSKVFNRIHGDNKKRTNLNKSIKNEYVRGNYSTMMSEGHRHGSRNVFNQQTNWPTMIRTGSYGYDAPFPSNTFAVELFTYIFDADHSMYFKPVCGTDGRTYKTECQLKKRACRREISTLQVAYKGQCQTSCKNVKCPQSMHCLEDQNLMPHCVSCSMKCPPYEKTLKSIVPDPSRLVCGVDGKTYRNLCEIKRAACIVGRSIPVAYRGACNDTANCNNIKCKDRQICLNDLITHRPRCVSCNFKCSRKRKPQGKRDGKPTTSGNDTAMKLCGRNNHTYNSWCQMIKDSCSTGLFIDIEHNGECRKSVSNSVGS
ncbi:hypothetical protein HA402_011596 [Bradysia odoriphaga]|nr:hypothetical protein HA402_011596 [Bradysia odoriphaga]